MNPMLTSWSRPDRTRDRSASLNCPGIIPNVSQVAEMAQASVPVGNTPEEYDAFIRAEIVKWSKVVKQANVQAD